MLYKTIVLEILQAHPELHNQLRQQRTLLAELEFHAGQLRTCHESWKDRLLAAKPDSDPIQIASEALELALKELEERLSPASPDETEAVSLDAAMAFISRLSPPA